MKKKKNWIDSFLNSFTFIFILWGLMAAGNLITTSDMTPILTSGAAFMGVVLSLAVAKSQTEKANEHKNQIEVRPYLVISYAELSNKIVSIKLENVGLKPALDLHLDDDGIRTFIQSALSGNRSESKYLKVDVGNDQYFTYFDISGVGYRQRLEFKIVNDQILYRSHDPETYDNMENRNG